MDTTENNLRIQLDLAIRKIQQLKTERDLAVRVAAEIIPAETMMHAGDDGRFGDVTYEDIRTVLKWSEELADG